MAGKLFKALPTLQRIKQERQSLTELICKKGNKKFRDHSLLARNLVILANLSCNLKQIMLEKAPFQAQKKGYKNIPFSKKPIHYRLAFLFLAIKPAYNCGPAATNALPSSLSVN